MTHWKEHFQYYDLFMNSFSAYRETLAFHVNELKNSQHVFDDGCGTGNLTLHLLSDKHEVTAIDKDYEAIEKTRKKCTDYYHKNLDIVQMDAENLKINDNTFDGISSMFVIPFVNNTEKYVSEMFRVAKPGGKIVISAWPPNADRAEYIVQRMQEELNQIGILPTHQKEWANFLISSKINTDYVASSKNTLILPLLLGEAGFNYITIHDKTPYENHALFITCNKPE